MTVNSDKSSLLDSLKIERAPVRRKGRSPLLYGGVAAVLILAGAAGWYFWPDSGIPVHVITVSAEGSGGSGASLDASGYVVARRKATLSAKISGKIAELHFEEGQKVQSGDIIARLDDSNYQAS